MFIDSNGMVVQHSTPNIVDTTDICNADVHYDPSPAREGKPSTTLPYEGTERCHGEVVVEKHATQHVTNKTHCEQHKAPTGCAYIDLTPKQGGKTTTKDQHRVKVIETEQKTVGHQAPQEPMSFVTR
jgi:hypothetical protein